MPVVRVDLLEGRTVAQKRKFDTDVRASGVPLSHYWFQEFPGRVHNFAAWNADLTDWLPHVMTVLKPAA
jgi:S-formylglutathione hydrolase FrmB